MLRGLSQGKDGLDCFAYSGGFAVAAAVGISGFVALTLAPALCAANTRQMSVASAGRHS